MFIICSPAEDAEDQVKHEEWAYYDERHEINPIKVRAHWIVCLKEIFPK